MGYAVESGGREGERGTVGREDRSSNPTTGPISKFRQFRPLHVACVFWKKTLKPLFFYMLEVKYPTQR